MIVKNLTRRILLSLMVCVLCCIPAAVFGVTDTTGGNITGQLQHSGLPDRTVISISASFIKLSDVQAYAHVYGTSASTNATILSSVELQSRTSENDKF